MRDLIIEQPLFDIPSYIKKQKLRCERACKIKEILWTKIPIEEKVIHFDFKRFYKTFCCKTKSNFS